MSDADARGAEVLDRIRDAIYMLDREWRFSLLNRAAEQYIGRPREELLGRVIWEVFPALRGTRIERDYRTALETQQPCEFEILTPVYQRWVEARVFPSPEGLSVYFVDVTARRQAEQTVRASEARFRALFEHTVDGVLLTSPDGSVLDANPAACRMLQRTREELCAAGRAGVVDRDDPRVPALLERRRLHGHARGEMNLVRKDGTRFPVELSSAIFTDADGNLRTSMTFRDLTEAKRNEAALRMLADASERLQSSLDLDAVLAGIAGLVVPAFADLAVIDVVEGESMRRVVAGAEGAAQVTVLQANPPDQPTERGASRVLRTGEPELVAEVSDEWLQAAARTPEHLAAARELAPASILMVPLIARGATVGVLSLSWRTPGRRYSDADLPLARGLADRAALAIDNARLYREAIEARQRRDEMIGIVSHDLRTPLNSIALRAQLLARRCRAGDFSPLMRGVEQANRLVQDLLTITAIDSGRLPLERRDEDLPGLLGEVVDLHLPIAEGRELTLTLDCPPELGVVHVDRHRLQQAIGNLIGNAIKFTRGGGRVDVRARADAGRRVIEVSDTGMGIPAEQLPRLFDRFWRGRDQREGVGLGLAIAKGVIEAHGGRLDVRSTPGEGTTFTISLPE